MSMLSISLDHHQTIQTGSEDMKAKQSRNLWFFVFAVLILSGCRSGLSERGPAPGLSPEPAGTVVEVQGENYPIQTIIRAQDGMNQLALPGGLFLMGSTDQDVNYGMELCNLHYSPCNRWFYMREHPQHEVTVSPFLIDQMEVSNQQFKLCVDAGDCSQPLVCKKGEPTYLDPEKWDHPVVCVDWEEANNYCSWVGGRLPTEAEWEYAFRGAGSLIFPWGDEFIGTYLNYCDTNCEQGHADNSADDGYQKTAPVGSFPAGKTWSGLENMAGNVFEWVSDWSADYGSESLSDPSGPQSGTEKLIKGCSWYSPAAYCRGASRPAVEPDTRYDFVGFRCARDPLPVVDGIIQPGEWALAEKYDFEDGSELSLMVADNHLFLAIRSSSDEMISANVFLSSESRIEILHTSAALGTAIYQPEGDTWQRTRDFEWCCRSRLDNASARAVREAFYHTENWLGINTYNGTENELEYKIRLTGSEEYLAVNFLRVNQIEDKQIWPVGITDGPAQPTIGGFPEEMDFSPEDWFAIEVQK